MNGVPPEIIQRAENLILLSMRGEDLVAACCQMPEDEATELKEAVCKLTHFMNSSDMSKGANRQGLPRGRRLPGPKDDTSGYTDGLYDY